MAASFRRGAKEPKIGTDAEAAGGLSLLRRQMEEIGYVVVTARGDVKR